MGWLPPYPWALIVPHTEELRRAAEEWAKERERLERMRARSASAEPQAKPSKGSSDDQA